MNKPLIICILLSVLLFYGCNDSSLEIQSHAISTATLSMDDKNLSVTSNVLSLGEIKQNLLDTDTFIFKIKNIGDRVIYIDKIDISCQCVTVLFSPDSIRQGEMAEIKGCIDLRKQRGHIRKSIFVKFRHGALKVLKINADIIE